jgi:hypothetical protein
MLGMVKHPGGGAAFDHGPAVQHERSVPHIIKAEVKSIYRKLDASSRNQAIIRARELGLLEG